MSFEKVAGRMFRTMSSGSEDDRLSRAGSSKMRRLNTFNLGELSTAEVTDLMQNTIYKTTLAEALKPYLPLILWILWIFTGAVFFSLYDEFGWAKGLLMSVNVGWSIGWTLPSEPSAYYSPGSKAFAIVHTAIGAIFLGVAVLFMARDLIENKDSWISMSTTRDEVENSHLSTEWWQHAKVLWRYYMSKLRVARFSIIWIVFGFVWYTYSGHEFDSVFGVADFVASTLCAGGYRSLSEDTGPVQYVITALYATIGIPLIKISLGLMLSLILKQPEDRLTYEKIVAPVTKREQEFMEAFGIDDGDGSVDYKEYVILIAVRIGSVPPHLVKEIQDRFDMLDRKRVGEISYNDLILPQMKRTRSERIQNFVQSAKSIGSFGGSNSSLNIESPPKATRKKVIPDPEDMIDDGNVVVIPRDRSVMTSRVSVEPEVSSNEDEKCGSNNQINDVVGVHRSSPVLRVAPSSESIECIQLPEEDASHRENVSRGRENDDNDDSDDADSLCSIQTFDGKEKEDETSIRQVSPTPTVVTPVHSSLNDCGTDKGAERMPTGTQSRLLAEKDIEDNPSFCSDTFTTEMKHFNIRGAQNTATHTIRRLTIKNTFRSTMSHGGSRIHDDDAADIKLTARQKEFFDEVEKIKNAQLQINLESDMNDLQQFFYFTLLPHLGAFIAWVIWLVAGAIFYTIHEDVSVPKGLYMSTSIGYGLFWIELSGDTASNVYSTFHFLIGIGVIAAAMALLAQKLLSQDNNWYSDALKAKKLEEAMETDGVVDDIYALFEYYWPRVKVHCFLFLFLAIGTCFVAFTFGWGPLDSFYFALSTMTSGGFLHIPVNSSDWCYLFMCFYVAGGVPIMSISCGILAHQIANKGSVQLKIDKVYAQVTGEEIEKMKWYGIEDGSGAVDSKEYVILILVRIGAISPEIISVLQERFDELDKKKSGKISYDDLNERDACDETATTESPV